MDARVALFHHGRDGVGESPLWDPARGCLWWVDVVGRKLWRARPDEAGRARDVARWDAPGEAAALALEASGALLVAVGLDLCRFAPEEDRWTRLAAAPHPAPGLRFNDGVVDPAGRFWIGTLHEAREPVGALYAFDADARSLRDADQRESGLRTQNGCAVSPDGRTFYLADSHPDVRAIWAYDLDAARGELANRRLFHRVERGRPDGAAIDREGCYWFAAVDGGCVTRLDPQGRVMSSIELPVSRPTKPAFGGPDLATLYVTTMSLGTDPAREPLAGSVFAVETGARGLEVWRRPAPA